MSLMPLRLAFYKGVGGKFGAAQFNLQKPHYFCPVSPKECKKDFDSTFPRECSGTKEFPHEPTLMESREGCVFLEMTSPSGPNVYDWTQKIILGLSISDMAQVLFALETGEEVKLLHDPGAKTSSQGQIKKTLSLTSPKGVKVGVLMNLSQQKGEQRISHTVPLSGPEAKELSVFLRSAMVTALAW